jgi:hypothetical protein
MKTATVADHLLYLRFEMQEAMKVLPPEVPEAKSTEPVVEVPAETYLCALST